MGLIDGKEDKLVAENDQWRLWKNSMTAVYQKDVEAYERDGFSIKGMYTVVYAENKINGSKVYLAMSNKTGKPVIDWTNGYDFDIRKMILVDDVRQECNIVNMAEDMQKKKRRRKKENR